MIRSNMFTLAVIALLLGELVQVLCTTPFPTIHQDRGLKSVSVGDTVTLHCFYEGNVETTFSWYKQILGNKPLLVSNFFKFDNNPTFYNEFKGNPRFTVLSDKGTYHLSISALKQSDSATYYCVTGYVNTMEFAEGTILHVKGPESNTKTFVQQSVSESVQPGDSVTLNCTIHTETCAGEHSMYWFRHGSGESRPGIIYTHGDRSGQCEKSPEAGSPTQSCVYNLPKTNLSLSDAGTYYCAVASCGKLLFGDGTKLDINERYPQLRILLYCLGAASVVFFFIIIVLAGTVLKMSKRKCPHCKVSGAVSQTRASICPADRGEQDEENLHYAALNLKKKSRPQRQRGNMERDTVYSGIRQ